MNILALATAIPFGLLSQIITIVLVGRGEPQIIFTDPDGKEIPGQRSAYNIFFTNLGPVAAMYVLMASSGLGGMLGLQLSAFLGIR